MLLYRSSAKVRNQAPLWIAALALVAVVLCIAGCRANKAATPNTTKPASAAQTDDGSQGVADLDRRESLLLDHYSWVSREQGTVRIPIERAMEIVAQGKTIEVLPSANTAPPMTGDKKPAVTAPLTNGFAPTTYEQTQAAERGR